MAQPNSIVFTGRRREPELTSPAKPTPKVIKFLSDIDDQESLRFQIPVIQFYKNDPSMRGKDPVKVIREAIAQTLVFYYPFAGRLREMSGRKLAVDCTGEGVTRLMCGGFVFALRLNHTMSDAAGLVQFMEAVSEIACGARAPSVQPVWQRELLNARNPPRITCKHHEYKQVPDTKGTIIPLDEMAHRSFFFGCSEMFALRRFVPPHMRGKCSNFEVLTACLWRSRTIALQADPDEEVRVLIFVNARTKFDPPLPAGYYGNAFVFPVALSTMGKLCLNLLGYALELVMKAKTDVTEEYMRSVADLMLIQGRSYITVVRTYLVSDVTWAGFREVDFGWGKAMYGGPSKSGVGAVLSVASFYIPVKDNTTGEDGVVVPVCLPAPAMKRFVTELDSMLKDDIEQQFPSKTTTAFISSAL